MRWFIETDEATYPGLNAAAQSLVDEFNTTHAEINLVLEAVPQADARTTFAKPIAASQGPDIVGPAGWEFPAAFFGQ